jgi:NADPH:quinone reductase
MSKVVTTRRVEYSEFGGVDELEIVERELDPPGPGEVLVEVLAAGINHIEAELREGQLEGRVQTSFPQTQGSDFAGVVRDLGEGVTDFRHHAEVLGHAGRSSHATHIIVPAKNLVHKPKHLTWEVAGGLALAGLTAWDTLDSLHLRAGETLVVSAAAGGVGSMEVQLAGLKGVNVIGTCGERNFDYLRQLGVKPVVYGDGHGDGHGDAHGDSAGAGQGDGQGDGRGDGYGDGNDDGQSNRHGDGLAERISALAPNGVSAYIDNFGQESQDLADRLGVSRTRFRSAKDRQDIELKTLDPDDQFRDHMTDVLKKLTALAGDRKLDVLISGFFPFRLVREAFEDLERLHARGKIVMGMHPANDEAPVRARDVADTRP